MGTWQTIDNAPRDGTHILVCRIPIGIRVTVNTHPPMVVHWFDDPEEPGFYMSGGIVQDSYNDAPIECTHWQAIDALPGSG